MLLLFSPFPPKFLAEKARKRTIVITALLRRNQTEIVPPFSVPRSLLIRERGTYDSAAPDRILFS
jgi:hypothetical protein